MSARRVFYQIYWALRGVIAPKLHFSQVLYTEKLKQVIRPDIRWLDLGCGNHLLPVWKAEEELRVLSVPKAIIGIDFDQASLKSHRSIKLLVRGDINKLPFRKSAFDLITANMVLEHLQDPGAQFLEVARVLKEGGLFLFHTPNRKGYRTIIGRLIPTFLKAPLIPKAEGTLRTSDVPTYYRANDEQTIRSLAKAAGLELKHIHFLTTDAYCVMIPPLVILELLWIRLIMSKPFRRWRTNLIVVLQKKSK